MASQAQIMAHATRKGFEKSDILDLIDCLTRYVLTTGDTTSIPMIMEYLAKYNPIYTTEICSYQGLKDLATIIHEYCFINAEG